MPSTSGMKGEGYYDQHSSAQGAAINLVLDWARNAASTLSLPPEPQPIAVLDLGSSEGRNAVGVMRAIGNSLRHRRLTQSLQIVFSDLPSNNFNRLFANLNDVALTGGMPTGVFASACAGSFYHALVPPGSVHLITCFNSLLWLDEIPLQPINDFIVYRRPQPRRPGLSVPAEVEAAYSSQASRDLQKFLLARAIELAPGGKLLLATPGDDDRGRICDGLYDVLQDACLDLVEAGKIERTRYERLIMPVYFRTLAETLQPIRETGSAVPDLFSVDRAEVLDVPIPFVLDYHQTGKVVPYANAFTGFIRAFSEPVVRAALVGDNSDQGLMDALYQRVQERLLAEPERYLFRYILVAVLLSRRSM